MTDRPLCIALHKSFVDWVIAATAAGLSCPVGRALFLCHRKRHTMPAWYHGVQKSRDLEMMRRARHSTAERWLAHWLRGGSLHVLSDPDDATSLARIQRTADRHLTEGDLLRRWIKRARRGRVHVFDQEPTHDPT